MNEHVTMIVTTVKEFRNEAEAFYQECSRETALADSDILVVAFVDADMAGIVRLCYEHERYVLRTMQIHPRQQRRGLGTIILNRFQDLLKEKKIDSIYCMPYGHLESFYGQIGFKKVPNQAAPAFLQERLADFKVRRPGQEALLMLREAK